MPSCRPSIPPNREADRDALSWLLRDVQLLPHEVRLRGRGYQVPVIPGHPLLSWRAALQQLLYEVCYTRRMSATAFDRWLPKALGGTDPGFVEEIARAAGSGARWDGGWRLVAAAPDGAWLAKGDTLRPVRTGEFAPDPVTGWREFVWLLVEREIAHSGPGFHFILGRVPGDVADEASPARFYLHTTASSAPRTSGVVARMLDDYRIPFRYKTLNSPGMYDRADASVLYVAARHTAIVENMLQDAFSDGPGRLLEPSVPLFSRQVGPGIGFAVDPANGESFGTDRCRLVAEGVIDAWRAGDMTEAGRWAAIDARFSAVGLSLDRPWLRAGQVEWT